MSDIQSIINELKDIEVDARKARDFAKSIADDSANPKQVVLDMLYDYSHNALIGITQAIRRAEQAKAKEESK